MMNISKDQILNLVNDTLSQDQVERSFIYWDKKIFQKGEKIGVGSSVFMMPFRGTILFVDLAPRYNWAHPSLYLLVNVENFKVEMRETSFPMYKSEYPPSYVILLKYGKEPIHERDFRIFS